MKRSKDRRRWQSSDTQLVADEDEWREPSPAGNPNKYFFRLWMLIRRAARLGLVLRVVLYVRVSSDKQGRRGNGVHQMEALRNKVKYWGRVHKVRIEIVGEFSEEDVSAWKLWPGGRPELVKAGQLARRKDAVIVAMHTSRFVRNRHHARGVLPTVEDFEKLQELVGGVQLATVIRPDTQEDRSADTKRGLKASKKRRGRPPKKRPGDKKRLRLTYKPQIVQRRKEGWKVDQLFDEYGKFGIKRSTIGDWIKSPD